MTEPSTSSGELAVGTNVVVAVPALLTALILSPAAAACSVKVYDNASAASGTVIAELLAVANGASVSLQFNSPVNAIRGLVAVVAGTGGIAQVMYQREN